MIPAGRNEDGQPTFSDSAKLDASTATASTATEEAEAPEQPAQPSQPSDPGKPGTPREARTAGEPGRTLGGRAVAAFGGIAPAFRRAYSDAWVGHLTLLVIYVAAGIAATWPRFTYLADSKLPATSDTSSFVWGIWWVAHEMLHPGNPFFTHYMAAPTGIQLGFSTLMPLVGFLTSPITVTYGPSASFSLVTILAPGLLCYAMYRAARLWLNQPGSIVAGAFFGLSSMLLWQNWFHLNIAIGTLFLPVTIEAAVRLRRKPSIAPAVALGVALGGSIMVNQESTVVAILLAAVILLPWIARGLISDRAALRPAIKPLLVGTLVALAVASPQLVAMAQQWAAGGAQPPAGQLAQNYTQFGVSLQTLFGPSPRLSNFGLTQLTSSYGFNNSVQQMEGLPTFGVVLSVLALLGLLVGWRKRVTWWFALLWLGSAVLALGTSLTFGTNCNLNNVNPGQEWGRYCHEYIPLLAHMHVANVSPPGSPAVYRPVSVSNLMPYTWLVRIPVLSGLREADRFALVGLIGAALLAGLTVDWLSRRKITRPLIAVVVALGVLEAGWAGGTVAAPPTAPGIIAAQTMPTTMPALDHSIVHDHTNSIVVDVPFGLRGGLALTGSQISIRAMLLATHDGHPRAVSYTAWVPKAAANGIASHAFYRYLMTVERGIDPTRAQLRQAAADLKTLHVGWAIVWGNMWTAHHPLQRLEHPESYLRTLGFRQWKAVCLVKAKSNFACEKVDHALIVLFRFEPKHAYKG